GEPAADPPAAAAWQAQRAPAARSLSPTGPLIAVLVLLAGGIGGLMVRDLNGLDADIGRLDADIAQFRADVSAGFKELRSDMDARFDELESDTDARFEKVDARFDELESDTDARFEKVDARFDELEEGQQEIALTLRALVAYLQASEGVDTALSGGVPGAETGTDPAASPQP
ncbi:MAG: hypothetical protein OXC00_13785, partial [Acidimicrobiaceae bacterium]|nr:hypothetical protein [Acidimicrobiaceae bacterium]